MNDLAENFEGLLHSSIIIMSVLIPFERIVSVIFHAPFVMSLLCRLSMQSFPNW